jgi:hypothetical protein
MHSDAPSNAPKRFVGQSGTERVDEGSETTVSVVSPTRRREPSTMHAVPRRTPSTHVPLRLPRSCTHKPSARSSNEACIRDTARSSTRTEACAEDPTTSRSPSSTSCGPPPSLQTRCSRARLVERLNATRAWSWVSIASASGRAMASIYRTRERAAPSLTGAAVRSSASRSADRRRTVSPPRVRVKLRVR